MEKWQRNSQPRPLPAANSDISLALIVKPFASHLTLKEMYLTRRPHLVPRFAMRKSDQSLSSLLM
jgi:hypothetical protein